MKCNKCAKPTVFEIEKDWDIPSNVVVAKCQRCENKGVREVTDFMKEPVRCTKCGAWKMEGLSCSICAKINAPSAQGITHKQHNITRTTCTYAVHVVMSGVKVMGKRNCGVDHTKERLTIWDRMLNQFDRGDTLHACGRLSKPEHEPRRGLLVSSWAVAVGILVCLIALETTAIEVDTAQAVNYKKSIVTVTPKQYAKAALNDDKQYKCILELYRRESNWRSEARNGSHYGIPQLRNEIMLSKTPIEQTALGIKYIRHRYGTTVDQVPNACKALNHLKTKGWH